MLINPSNETQLQKGKQHFKNLVKRNKKFNLTAVSDSRTAKQNRALHLYFSFISNELNELGMEFKYQGLIIEDLSSRYTSEIVKQFIWRPIQIALFSIKSTKNLDTKQMNQIIDVITKYFAERGINLDFPSIETLINR